jgi:FAD/FMN-containing dehydrogenase
MLSALLSTALLVSSVAAVPSADTQAACAAIKSAIPSSYQPPLSLSYIAERTSYWSTALRDARPACIVMPRSVVEMAMVVTILNTYPSVEFAVKSGGHTPNVRHSSIHEGVLISTANLVGATYDAETGLALVRPGGEWNDVIGDLEEYGVAVVGGRLGEFITYCQC